MPDEEDLRDTRYFEWDLMCMNCIRDYGEHWYGPHCGINGPPYFMVDIKATKRRMDEKLGLRPLSPTRRGKNGLHRK